MFKIIYFDLQPTDGTVSVLEMNPAKDRIKLMKHIGVLFGQRMHADIAMLLLHSSSIIFLDEPTLGLDVLAKQQMIGFLKQIPGLKLVKAQNGIYNYEFDRKKTELHKIPGLLAGPRIVTRFAMHRIQIGRHCNRIFHIFTAFFSNCIVCFN